MISAIGCPYFRRAFGWCVPVGGLGGLIGLGGGEFRLPVLMYGIGFDARSAVPLNLVTSLVTLTFPLAAFGCDSPPDGPSQFSQKSRLRLPVGIAPACSANRP